MHPIWKYSPSEPYLTWSSLVGQTACSAVPTQVAVGLMLVVNEDEAVLCTVGDGSELAELL